MNTKQLIAAAALTLVGSTAAFAQSEIELQHFGANQVSATTRAEVRAEFLRARAAGEVPAASDLFGAASPVVAATRVTDPTRAQLRAEVLKGLADGSLVQSSEVTVFAKDTTGPVRSREEVRAEARAYTRAGHTARVQAGH